MLEEAVKYFKGYTDDHIDQFAKQVDDFCGAFKSHWQVIDEQEQYSSRECIVLHGIPEPRSTNDKRNENTDQVFVDTINTRLNENIT